MVDNVENYLHDEGFRNIRARHYDSTIRIEVSPEEINMFFNDKTRKRIVKKIKELGYTFITSFMLSNSMSILFSDIFIPAFFTRLNINARMSNAIVQYKAWTVIF